MKLIKLLFSVSLCLSFAVNADVEIENAKARATFAMAQTGAAYFSITNKSTMTSTLISVSVPESIASSAEIHTMFMDGDMMKMQELEQGIALIPSQTVNLKSGGKHIMLMGLKGPLKEGMSIPITLNFDNQEKQIITVPVVKMN